MTFRRTFLITPRNSGMQTMTVRQIAEAMKPRQRSIESAPVEFAHKVQLVFGSSIAATTVKRSAEDK